MLNMIQKGLTGINNVRTSNNPLTQASLRLGSRLLQNNAPNIVSMANTIANTYNTAMGTLGVMGNYFNQGTTQTGDNLINRMAEINWARGYQWDVYLEEPPEGDFSPNNFGLPVFDIKETCAGVGDSYNLNASNTDYQFPLRKKLFDIQLSMFDNEKGDMEQYFEAWITQVYPWDGDGGYTQYLSNSVRTLTVRKLDSMKKIIFERKYLVYPEIQLTGVNNSESAIRTLTIPLVVAGFLGKSNPANNSGLADKTRDSNVFLDAKDKIQGVLTGKENPNVLAALGRQAVESTKKVSFKGVKEFVKNNKDSLSQVAANQLNKASKRMRI